MKIVDTQWHEPAPHQEWRPEDLETRRKLMTEILLAHMNAIGVDAVLIFPIEDNEWAESLGAEHPQKFASVPMITAAQTQGNQQLNIDPDAPDLEKQIADMRRRPGVVAVRILGAFFPEEVDRMRAGGNDRAFAACEKEGLPVFLFISGHPEMAANVAESFPDLTIIIDHIGIKQPPLEEPDEPMWRRLPDLLALAKYPNISVKLCGAPVMSRETYPFRDIWPNVRQIVEAFGAERVMWASDNPRFQGRIGWVMRVAEAERHYPGKHTYSQSLSFLRDTELLNDDEKALVLGGAAQRILNWPPKTDS